MVTRKITSAVIVVIIISVFFGMLIHGELVTDEKRFLVTELAKINQTVLGQPFEYPSNPSNIGIHFVEILPSAESGWHTHDKPLVVTILHGDLLVYYCYDANTNHIDLEYCPDKGTIKHYQAGDSFVEAIDVEHNGVNEGVIPVKIHVVALNPVENYTMSIHSQDHLKDETKSVPKNRGPSNE